VKWRVGAVVAVAAMLGAAPAGAHETQIESSVDVFEGFIGGKGGAGALGGVDGNPKCVSQRSVKLRAMEVGEPPVVIDRARTSTNGGWHMFGLFPPGYAVLDVKMVKKNIGPSGHKHICEGDVAFVDSIKE
jgi:hypothetical protein